MESSLARFKAGSTVTVKASSSDEQRKVKTMLPQRQNNPLAPAHLNGLSSIGANYQDKHFDKSYSITLQANQTLLNQAVQLDRDADFFWEAVSVTYTGQPFGVRFTDSTGYQLSDTFVGSFAFAASTGIGAPYVLLPPLFLPAGSAILLDLQEQSGTTNGPIEFVFHGRKRFYDGN